LDLKGTCLGFTGIHLHVNATHIIKLDHGPAELEGLCCVQKIQKAWEGKGELIEEVYFEPLEARNGDITNNRFQVSANTSEPELAKVRQHDMCRGGWTRELPHHIMVGNREGKDNPEHL